MSKRHQTEWRFGVSEQEVAERSVGATLHLLDLDPPSVRIDAPLAGTQVGPRPALTLSWDDIGRGVDLASAQLQVNGVAVALQCDGTLCTPATALTEPRPGLILTLADRAGNRSAPARLQLILEPIAKLAQIAEQGSARTKAPRFFVCRARRTANSFIFAWLMPLFGRTPPAPKAPRGVPRRKCRGYWSSRRSCSAATTSTPNIRWV